MTPMRLLASAVLAAAAIASQSASAADTPAQASWYSGTYQITITNLTRGTSFTPFLVASHSSGIHLFELGSPASPELRTLAEEGNPMPLADLLESTQGVHDVATGDGPTAPGTTTTIEIRAGLQDRISVAAMLVPTNDGFVAIDATQVPLPHSSETLYATGYDAGTEQNDELCSSIPGPNYPECGGPGGGAQVGNGEGYVFVHAGIHGVGDFDPADRDWRNPVAKIVIKRMH